MQPPSLLSVMPLHVLEIDCLCTIEEKTYRRYIMLCCIILQHNQKQLYRFLHCHVISIRAINYLPGSIMKVLITLSNFPLKLKLLISLTSIASSFCSFLISNISRQFSKKIGKRQQVCLLSVNIRGKYGLVQVSQVTKMFRLFTI